MQVGSVGAHTKYALIRAPQRSPQYTGKACIVHLPIVGARQVLQTALEYIPRILLPSTPQNVSAMNRDSPSMGGQPTPLFAVCQIGGEATLAAPFHTRSRDATRAQSKVALWPPRHPTSPATPEQLKPAPAYPARLTRPYTTPFADMPALGTTYITSSAALFVALQPQGGPSSRGRDG